MREWNRRGLRPPQAPFGPLPEHPWTRNSVTTVLRNPRLAGMAAYKGEMLDGVTGRWDAILGERSGGQSTGCWPIRSASRPEGCGRCSAASRCARAGTWSSTVVNHAGRPVSRCQSATRGRRPGPHVAVRAEPVDEWVEGSCWRAGPGAGGPGAPPPHVDTAGLRAEAAAIRAQPGPMAATPANGLITRSMLAAAERGNARLAEIGAELAEAAGAGRWPRSPAGRPPEPCGMAWTCPAAGGDPGADRGDSATRPGAAAVGSTTRNKVVMPNPGREEPGPAKSGPPRTLDWDNYAGVIWQGCRAA